MRTVFLNGIRILFVLLSLFTAACGGGDSYDPPTHFEMTGKEFAESIISLEKPWWAADYNFPVNSAVENGEKVSIMDIEFDGQPTSLSLKTYLDSNDMVTRVQIILKEDPRLPYSHGSQQSKWWMLLSDTTHILLGTVPEYPNLEEWPDHSESNRKIQEKIDNNLLSDAIRYEGLNYQLSFDDSVEPPVFSVTISY